MNTSTAGIRRATGQIVVGSFQKIAWNQLEGAPTLNHIHVTETFEGDTEVATWFVVPGSGTGELTGLRGEGGFEAKRGEHARIVLRRLVRGAPPTRDRSASES